MNKFRYFFITFLTVYSLSINAQQDQKAKDILDKVSATNKSYKTIEAEFIFTRENIQDNTKNTSKGKVDIKGNKYWLDLMGTESFYDGKTLWSFIKDANEVNITEPDPNEEGTLNPAKLFTIYESGFKYKFVGDKFENAKALYEIDLFPKDLKKDYSRITLKIDKDKMQISSFKRSDKNGIRYTIELTKITPNVVLNDTKFTFDKKTHPKTQINDMR